MENSRVRRAVLSTVICSATMWYDYILLGSLAGTIGELFFPPDDRHSALIRSFWVYAVGFCLRPLGASFFGHIGDRYGRRTSQVLSAVSMTVPMGFMSIIPTYEISGILATGLMVLCILLLGFSLGGGSGSGATFLVELSKNTRAGLFSGLELMTAVSGSVFSVAIIVVCKYFTGDAFGVWGWRIPFILGFVAGVISIFMRSRAAESPEYQEYSTSEEKQKGLVKSPVWQLFRYHKKTLMVALGLGCVECCCFHTFMVFLPNYVEVSPHAAELSSLAVGTVGFLAVLLSAGLTVGFGALSDLWGYRTVIGAASVSLLFLPVPVFWLLSQNSVLLVALGYLIFSIPFTATLGPSSAAIAELFPSRVRCTGLSLARNTSAALGGGLAPAVCSLLIKTTNWHLAPGLYVMFWAVVALIAIGVAGKGNLHFKRKKRT